MSKYALPVGFLGLVVLLYSFIALPLKVLGFVGWQWSTVLAGFTIYGVVVLVFALVINYLIIRGDSTDKESPEALEEDDVFQLVDKGEIKDHQIFVFNNVIHVMVQVVSDTEWRVASSSDGVPFSMNPEYLPEKLLVFRA